MDEPGVLRRSLRRINPFRKDLFRLPATPRLSRKGNKDKQTDWNFEAGLSDKKSSTRKTTDDTPAPSVKEAQNVVRLGLSELCASLPHTTYDSQGNVDRVSWSYSCDSAQSTISLMSRNNYRSSVISTRKMNGIFQKSHRFSVSEPIEAIRKPLFRLENFYSSAELDQPFIGREWIFREVYEAAVLDKVDVTFLQGKPGTGKSEILKQIILHSSFYTTERAIDSTNYEWLKAVSARIVAWHFCDVQDASTCSIPEFICNISAWLCSSKILKSYERILNKDSVAIRLLNMEECVKMDPVEVFKRTICRPLEGIQSVDEGCLLILVDGLDHAEFHRTDDGNSIGAFLNKVRQFLPTWIKFVVTGEEFNKFDNIQRRTIFLDGDEFDERINRDQIMLAQSSFMASNIACPENMLDQLVVNSKGNSLYIITASKFLTYWTLRNITVYDLPETVDEFLEQWLVSSSRTSLTLTEAAVLDVLLASLTPQSPETLNEVLLQAPYISNLALTDVSHAIESLDPLLKTTQTGNVLLRSTTIRNFLVHKASESFNVRMRNGHMLLALHMTSVGHLNPDGMFRIAHHLLKANPLKYLRQDFPFDFTKCRSSYHEWLSSKSSDITTSLCSHRSLRYPNLKATSFLLTLGARVDVEFGDGTTLIEVAARNSFSSLTVLLLQNTNDTEVSSIARICASVGDVTTFKMLEANLDRDTVAECCELAASKGHLQILSRLLRQLQDNDSEAECVRVSALAAASNDQCNTLEYLLQHSSNNVDECMRNACDSGSANVISMLLVRGVTLPTDWTSNTNPVYCAVQCGSWQMLVAALAMANVDVDEQVDGRTPLHLAARKAEPMVVELLINHNADIEAKDDTGATPLFHAVRARKIEIVKCLLRAGASPNHKDYSETWLCHVSATSGDVEVLQLLMDSGMDVNNRDANGDRPIEVSIGRNHLKIVQFLVARGARLRGVTWEKAVETNFEVVFMLLNKLMDDAALLTRKKRQDDAMQRLEYAIDRCQRLSTLNNDNETQQRLHEVSRGALIAKGKLLRRSGNTCAALECCSRAETTSGATFDVYLLRAKCLFDARQVHAAREEATKALAIKPFDDECRSLLSVLQNPQTHISRF